MHRQSLKLSLVQDNPVAGDVGGNLARAIRHLRREAEGGADLVIFSECFLSGYPIGDLALRPGFIGRVGAAVAALSYEIGRLQADEGITVAALIGAPRPGRRLPYNSAFLIEPGNAIRIVDKRELPNFDVFDEHRTFARSDATRHEPLLFGGFNLGVMICEDMWHGEVPDSLASEGADLLIAINGSPYHGDKQAVRLDLANALMRRTGLPLIYVNQVGGQDELVFDGGSFFANSPKGHIAGKAFETDVIRAELMRDADGKAHLEMRGDEDRTAVTYPANRIEADYRAIVTGLADYVRKTGTPRVFVGVSGGLDSALVLTLAVDAIGAQNVVGVMMPSDHTGQESLDLARDLMTRLGVHTRTLPIHAMFEAVDGALSVASDDLAPAVGVEAAHGVARENYQARLRGMALMGLSNALGGIVLSTGNKSELAVGYSTLYGDMVGGFNPIKSLYKSDAFRMCAWRNETAGDAPPIPQGIIDRKPSAELSPGQTDEAALGSYDALDAVLREMIDHAAPAGKAVTRLRALFGKDLDGMIAGMTPRDYVGRIYDMVRRAQYKRYQAPPGVKLNATDFGLGWRFPLAGTYEL